MLLIVSDIHLADRGTVPTIDLASLNRCFRNAAMEAKALGSETLDIILLGDIFEILKSRKWFDRNTRPWEGLRIWRECQERRVAQSPQVPLVQAAAQPSQRYGTPALVVPRLGQGIFRVAVTEAYNRACAVTQEHSLPALEAAHIKPFALDGPHSVTNGILLRSDLHRLFDRGYVTVTTEHKLEVSKQLKEHFRNGRSYYPLQGKEIMVPQSISQRPDRDLLRWHNEHVFLDR